MAIDLAPQNIRVNGISPGMIASPFNQRFSEGEETGSAWANDNSGWPRAIRKTLMVQ